MQVIACLLGGKHRRLVELVDVASIPDFVLNELYTRDTSRDAFNCGNGHFRKVMLSLETLGLNEDS